MPAINCGSVAFEVHPDAHCYFNDIINTSDSGYLVGGYTFTSPVNPTQDMWLLKLDSMGCDTPGCHPPDTGTGIFPPAKREALKLYPNPSDGRFHLSLSGINPGEAVRLQVYNRLGQQVHHQLLPPVAGKLEEELDLRHLAPGIYLVEISTDTERWVQKIVIE